MERGRNLSFLRSLFRKFYEENGALLETPSSMERREFGFLTLDRRIMVRHLSFEDKDELLEFIVGRVPSDCYRSAAYYMDPGAPEMSGKGWLGADLVFDIDADHIPSLCKEEHDRWRCLDCGEEGKGTAPDLCPRCGSKRIEERLWFCSRCLEAAKLETVKLLDFLTSDFGLTYDELKVYFSGHRGYHVHVESEALRSLDQDARREVADYITGLGIDPSMHGLLHLRGEDELSKLLECSSWAGRLMRGGYEFILEGSVEDFVRIGLSKYQASALVENRDAVLESWWKGGFLKSVKGLGRRGWAKVFLEAARREAALIDTVVTTDVHRLIRLEGSLHGKTGFRKTKVSGSLESFDPLKEAIAFNRGEVRVRVKEAPEFRVGDSIYGPYSDEEVELPTAAAVLLICKGLAHVV